MTPIASPFNSTPRTHIRPPLRALTHLSLGKFAEGWAGFESRWCWTGPRPNIGPQWDGSDPKGKRLLIYTEQGLGDTLQFCRYLPLLHQSGASIFFQLQARLRNLIAASMPWLDISSKGDQLPPTDAHCALLSLPHLVGTTLDTIPARVPYIAPPQQLATQWEDLIKPKRGLRVGFGWAGSRDHRNDAHRSILPSAFAPLFNIEDATFFSLQVGGQPDPLPPEHVIDLSPQLTDFAETAGAIANLDLVISVDTSVAHLAGAMGKPVWIILPFVPDWRWLLDRTDSPWYPTARLFRQKSSGDWAPIITEVAEALNMIARTRAGGPTRSSVAGGFVMQPYVSGGIFPATCEASRSE